MVSISIGWLLLYYCVNYIYHFCNLTDCYNIIIYNAAGDMCTYMNYVRVHTHTHTHIYIYIFIYVCIYLQVCMYLCVDAQEYVCVSV